MTKQGKPDILTSELFRRFQDVEACHTMMSMLSLVANQSRFRILCLLTAGEFCVNDIVRFVGGKSSNISQQLRILMLAGYISNERVGRQIYYKLENERVRKLIEFLHGLADLRVESE